MTKKQAPVSGELIYGIHPIIELLRAKKRKITRIYTTKPEPKAWAQIAALLPSHTPVQYVNRDVLHRMAQTTDHQGILAYAQPFPLRKKMFDPQKQPFLIMLDGIQDPHNVGAIIRSAYCTGIDGIVLPEQRTSPLTGSALKASAGLAEHLEILTAPNSYVAARDLKEAGYNLYMAVFKGEKATEVTFKAPLCLIIGSEGQGISPEIIRFGSPVTIPQRTTDISYNASVAAGILLFLSASQLKKI